MNFKKNIPIYISLLLTVILIIAVYSQVSVSQMSIFIGADTLYLPSFFHDLFIDKSKNIVWYTPAATCFFPDLILFFIVHFFTSNFIAAMFFTGMIMNILLIIAFYLLIKESVKNISPLYLSIGINLMLLFHLTYLYVGDYFFSFYLTITNYHLGVYISSMFCLYFAIRFLKTIKFINLIVLILIYICSFASDFLTIFDLTVPLLALSILFLKKQYRIRALYLLLTNILGFMGGYFVYHKLMQCHSLSIMDASYLTLNLDRIGESYSIMFHHHLLFLKRMDIRTVIVLLCILSFIISTVILIRHLIKYIKTKNIETGELTEMIYLLFFVTQVIAVYNAPAINGIYVGLAHLRYNVYVFFLSIFNCGYLFYKLSLVKSLTKYTHILSIVLLIVFSFLSLRELYKKNIKDNMYKLFHYYPEYVQNIDDLCVRHKIKYGLSTYSLAKPATMLSKNNIKIYHTHENLRATHHITNENWYYGTKDGKTAPPVFQFVIPEGLTDSIVYQKLEHHILDTLKQGNITMILTDPFTIERGTKNLIFE